VITSTDTHESTDTAEMLLLLIWRHIQHYTSPSFTLPSGGGGLSSSTLGLGASTAGGKSKQSNVLNAAMRFLAAPDPEAFKGDVGRKLGPLLGKLEGLDLDGEGTNWNEGYIEIMSRRLKDALGLLQDDGFGGRGDEE
jgi:nuclear pore complex protein Nup205